jgi:hypothetical protein
MPVGLGTIIAERKLARSGSRRVVLARLGRPRPSRKAPWECPYQVLGASDGRVRVGLGEDALQSLLHACVGLRLELVRVGATWLSDGVSGIPPFVPDAFGAGFTAHLEALIERELEKLKARLKRAYEAKQQRLKRARSKSRATPAATDGQVAVAATRRRGVSAAR